MNKIYLSLLLILLFQSCKQNSLEDSSEIIIEKQWIEIKKTSDLRTYEKFLIEHPDFENLPEILDSIKVLWEDIISNSRHDFCRGHCFTVFMNNEGQLLFNSKIVDDQQLILDVKEALLFPERLGRSSLKDGLSQGEQNIPLPIKGIIDLKGAEIQDSKRYSEVIKLVKSAFMSVRDDYALAIFQKRYMELNQIESDRIQTLVPLNISFEKYIPPPPPPPIEYKE